LATNNEFKNLTVITVSMFDIAGVYNDTNFAPSIIVLSGYILVQ